MLHFLWQGDLKSPQQSASWQKKTLNTDICQEVFSLSISAGPLALMTSLARLWFSCVWQFLTSKNTNKPLHIAADPNWKQSWPFIRFDQVLLLRCDLRLESSDPHCNTMTVIWAKDPHCLCLYTSYTKSLRTFCRGIFSFWKAKTNEKYIYNI